MCIGPVSLNEGVLRDITHDQPVHRQLKEDWICPVRQRDGIRSCMHEAKRFLVGK